MRSYPTNSPQAAARIVALTLMADGHVSLCEMSLLDRIAAHDQLGLERQHLHQVMQGLCEDLLHTRQLSWADACRIDPSTLQRLLGEIEDPQLQMRLFSLCAQVVEADDHVCESEQILLSQAVEHWGLQFKLLSAQDRAAAAFAH
jgi:uncharacterized tellurite resistance protein B-like protein